jgi:hypothetical protein
MSNNIRKWLGVLTVAVCFGWVLRVGVTQPDHTGWNWDVIGYAAALYKQDGLSGEPLSRAVYSDVLKEFGERDLCQLTAGASQSQYGSCPAEQVPDAHYRATVFNDPVSLEQQIPFYSIRVLYLLSIRIADQFVHSYSSSAILVDAIYAALCVIAIALLLEHFHLSPFYLPVILFISRVAFLGRIGTPDALACLLSLLALLLFLKRSRWVFVAIAALPLARTDFVIMSLILCAFSFRLISPRLAILSAALSVGFLVSDNYFNGNYGYLTLFNFALINIDPYPVEMKVSTHLASYVHAYLSGAKAMFNSRHFFAFMCALLLFGMRIYRRKSLTEVDYIFIASMLFTFVHLLLFPQYSDRHFVFPVIVSLIFLINRMTEGVGFATGRLRTA